MSRGATRKTTARPPRGVARTSKGAAGCLGNDAADASSNELTPGIKGSVQPASEANGVAPKRASRTKWATGIVATSGQWLGKVGPRTAIEPPSRVLRSATKRKMELEASIGQVEIFVPDPAVASSRKPGGRATRSKTTIESTASITSTKTSRSKTAQKLVSIGCEGDKPAKVLQRQHSKKDDKRPENSQCAVHVQATASKPARSVKAGHVSDETINTENELDNKDVGAEVSKVVSHASEVSIRLDRSVKAGHVSDETIKTENELDNKYVGAEVSKVVFHASEVSIRLDRPNADDRVEDVKQLLLIPRRRKLEVAPAALHDDQRPNTQVAGVSVSQPSSVPENRVNVRAGFSSLGKRAPKASKPPTEQRQLRLEELSGVLRSRRPALHATVADVPRWHKRLESAVNAAAPPRTILRYLHRLSLCTKFFRRAELIEALRARGTGVLCISLKGHADADVSHFASRLVETWRTLALNGGSPSNPGQVSSGSLSFQVPSGGHKTTGCELNKASASSSSQQDESSSRTSADSTDSDVVPDSSESTHG